MNSKPVFITGATGSIGAVLARRLTHAGQPVRALVRDPRRATALRSVPNVTIVPGDLTRPETLRGCLDGCSVVYHCAGKIDGTDRKAYQAINVEGTMALIDEAGRCGVDRFVHVSTIGVYAFTQAENITEDFPWPPCGEPYVATKREAERVVMGAEARVPVAIARAGETFGPEQFSWTVNVASRAQRSALAAPTERESGFLNLIYIDNLVDALLLMRTHPAAVGEAFNVVDGWPIRTSDYIKHYFQLTRKRPLVLPGILMKVAVGAQVLAELVQGREPATTLEKTNFSLHKITVSNHKLRTRLGWEPAVDREEAFRRTDEWLRQAGYVR